jgi:hypothetical protein
MPRKTAGNGTTTRSRKATTPAQPVSAVTEPNNVIPINLEDEIRRRAYEIYQERGSTPGNEHEDWVAAEREVRKRFATRYSA